MTARPPSGNAASAAPAGRGGEDRGGRHGGRRGAVGATVAGHSRSSHHPAFVPAGEAAGRGPARGAVLVPPPPAPDVAFGDTVTLVCLGYTHCPNVCPVILGDTAAALRPAPAALRRRVQVVFVRL